MDPDKDWYSSAPQEEPDERDDMARLGVPIDSDTDERLKALERREGVTREEAVRRMVAYGSTFYQLNRVGGRSLYWLDAAGGMLNPIRVRD